MFIVTEYAALTRFNCIYYNVKLLFNTKYEFWLLKWRMNIYELRLSLLSLRGFPKFSDNLFNTSFFYLRISLVAKCLTVYNL